MVRSSGVNKFSGCAESAVAAFSRIIVLSDIIVKEDGVTWCAVEEVTPQTPNRTELLNRNKKDYTWVVVDEEDPVESKCSTNMVEDNSGRYIAVTANDQGTSEDSSNGAPKKEGFELDVRTPKSNDERVQEDLALPSCSYTTPKSFVKLENELSVKANKPSISSFTSKSPACVGSGHEPKTSNSCVNLEQEFGVSANRCDIASFDLKSPSYSCNFDDLGIQWSNTNKKNKLATSKTDVNLKKTDVSLDKPVKKCVDLRSPSYNDNLDIDKDKNPDKNDKARPHKYSVDFEKVEVMIKKFANKSKNLTSSTHNADVDKGIDENYDDMIGLTNNPGTSKSRPSLENIDVSDNRSNKSHNDKIGKVFHVNGDPDKNRKPGTYFVKSAKDIKFCVRKTDVGYPNTTILHPIAKDPGKNTGLGCAKSCTLSDKHMFELISSIHGEGPISSSNSCNENKSRVVELDKLPQKVSCLTSNKPIIKTFSFTSPTRADDADYANIPSLSQTYTSSNINFTNTSADTMTHACGDTVNELNTFENNERYISKVDPILKSKTELSFNKAATKSVITSLNLASSVSNDVCKSNMRAISNVHTNFMSKIDNSLEKYNTIASDSTYPTDNDPRNDASNTKIANINNEAANNFHESDAAFDKTSPCNNDKYDTCIILNPDNNIDSNASTSSTNSTEFDTNVSKSDFKTIIISDSESYNESINEVPYSGSNNCIKSDEMRNTSADTSATPLFNSTCTKVNNAENIDLTSNENIVGGKLRYVTQYDNAENSDFMCIHNVDAIDCISPYYENSMDIGSTSIENDNTEDLDLISNARNISSPFAFNDNAGDIDIRSTQNNEDDLNKPAVKLISKNTGAPYREDVFPMLDDDVSTRSCASKMSDLGSITSFNQLKFASMVHSSKSNSAVHDKFSIPWDEQNTIDPTCKKIAKENAITRIDSPTLADSLDSIYVNVSVCGTNDWKANKDSEPIIPKLSKPCEDDVNSVTAYSLISSASDSDDEDEGILSSNVDKTQKQRTSKSSTNLSKELNIIRNVSFLSLDHSNFSASVLNVSKSSNSNLQKCDDNAVEPIAAVPVASNRPYYSGSRFKDFVSSNGAENNKPVSSKNGYTLAQKLGIIRSKSPTLSRLSSFTLGSLNVDRSNCKSTENNKPPETLEQQCSKSSVSSAEEFGPSVIKNTIKSTLNGGNIKDPNTIEPCNRHLEESVSGACDKSSLQNNITSSSSLKSSRNTIGTDSQSSIKWWAGKNKATVGFRSKRSYLECLDRELGSEKGTGTQNSAPVIATNTPKANQLPSPHNVAVSVSQKETITYNKDISRNKLKSCLKRSTQIDKSKPELVTIGAGKNQDSLFDEKRNKKTKKTVTWHPSVKSNHKGKRYPSDKGIRLKNDKKIVRNKSAISESNHIKLVLSDKVDMETYPVEFPNCYSIRLEDIPLPDGLPPPQFIPLPEDQPEKHDDVQSRSRSMVYQDDEKEPTLKNVTNKRSVTWNPLKESTAKDEPITKQNKESANKIEFTNDKPPSKNKITDNKHGFQQNFTGLIKPTNSLPPHPVNVVKASSLLNCEQKKQETEVKKIKAAPITRRRHSLYNLDVLTKESCEIKDKSNEENLKHKFGIKWDPPIISKTKECPYNNRAAIGNDAQKYTNKNQSKVIIQPCSVRIIKSRFETIDIKKTPVSKNLITAGNEVVESKFKKLDEHSNNVTLSSPIKDEQKQIIVPIKRNKLIRSKSQDASPSGDIKPDPKYKQIDIFQNKLSNVNVSVKSSNQTAKRNPLNKSKSQDLPEPSSYSGSDTTNKNVTHGLDSPKSSNVPKSQRSPEKMLGKLKCKPPLKPEPINIKLVKGKMPAHDVDKTKNNCNIKDIKQVENICFPAVGYKRIPNDIKANLNNINASKVILQDIFKTPENVIFKIPRIPSIRSKEATITKRNIAMTKSHETLSNFNETTEKDRDNKVGEKNKSRSQPLNESVVKCKPPMRSKSLDAYPVHQEELGKQKNMRNKCSKEQTKEEKSVKRKAPVRSKSTDTKLSPNNNEKKNRSAPPRSKSQDMNCSDSSREEKNNESLLKTKHVIKSQRSLKEPLCKSNNVTEYASESLQSPVKNLTKAPYKLRSRNNSTSCYEKMVNFDSKCNTINFSECTDEPDRSIERVKKIKCKPPVRSKSQDAKPSCLKTIENNEDYSNKAEGKKAKNILKSTRFSTEHLTEEGTGKRKLRKRAKSYDVRPVFDENSNINKSRDHKATEKDISQSHSQNVIRDDILTKKGINEDLDTASSHEKLENVSTEKSAGKRRLRERAKSHDVRPDYHKVHKKSADVKMVDFDSRTVSKCNTGNYSECTDEPDRSIERVKKIKCKPPVRSKSQDSKPSCLKTIEKNEDDSGKAEGKKAKSILKSTRFSTENLTEEGTGKRQLRKRAKSYDVRPVFDEKSDKNKSRDHKATEKDISQSHYQNVIQDDILTKKGINEDLDTASSHFQNEKLENVSTKKSAGKRRLRERAKSHDVRPDYHKVNKKSADEEMVNFDSRTVSKCTTGNFSESKDLPDRSVEGVKKIKSKPPVRSKSQDSKPSCLKTIEKNEDDSGKGKGKKAKSILKSTRFSTENLTEEGTGKRKLRKRAKSYDVRPVFDEKSDKNKSRHHKATEIDICQSHSQNAIRDDILTKKKGINVDLDAHFQNEKLENVSTEKSAGKRRERAKSHDVRPEFHKVNNNSANDITQFPYNHNENSKKAVNKKDTGKRKLRGRSKSFDVRPFEEYCETSKKRKKMSCHEVEEDTQNSVEKLKNVTICADTDKVAAKLRTRHKSIDEKQSAHKDKGGGKTKLSDTLKSKRPRSKSFEGNKCDKASRTSASTSNMKSNSKRHKDNFENSYKNQTIIQNLSLDEESNHSSFSSISVSSTATNKSVLWTMTKCIEDSPKKHIDDLSITSADVVKNKALCYTFRAKRRRVESHLKNNQDKKTEQTKYDKIDNNVAENCKERKENPCNKISVNENITKSRFDNDFVPPVGNHLALISKNKKISCDEKDNSVTVVEKESVMRWKTQENNKDNETLVNYNNELDDCLNSKNTYPKLLISTETTTAKNNDKNDTGFKNTSKTNSCNITISSKSEIANIRAYYNDFKTKKYTDEKISNDNNITEPASKPCTIVSNTAQEYNSNLNLPRNTNFIDYLNPTGRKSSDISNINNENSHLSSKSNDIVYVFKKNAHNNTNVKYKNETVTSQTCLGKNFDVENFITIIGETVVKYTTKHPNELVALSNEPNRIDTMIQMVGTPKHNELEKVSVPILKNAMEMNSTLEKIECKYLNYVDDNYEYNPEEEKRHGWVSAIGIIFNSNCCPFRRCDDDYMCFYCDEKFPIISVLENHTLIWHSPNKDKVEETIKQVSGKVRVNFSNFSCKICLHVASGYFALKEHFKFYHRIDLHLVNDGIFPYKMNDEEHVCVVCRQNFRSYNLLTIHMSTHYPVYLCDDCGQSFATSMSLKSHSLNHVTTACEMCDQVFTDSETMKVHVENAHTHVDKGNSSKNWVNQLNLIKVHGFIRDYLCEWCGVVLENEMKLKSHIRHTHNTERKCNVCRLVCPVDSFMEHMKSHIGDKIYQCLHCGNSYVSEQGLCEHMQRQHDIE